MNRRLRLGPDRRDHSPKANHPAGLTPCRSRETDTAAPAVRAKFHCHSVRTTEPQRTFQGPLTDPTTEVHMSAVYGDGTDNAAWSKETPQGFLKMIVTNPDASSAFVAGQEYFLDFTPVPPAAAVASLPLSTNTARTMS